MNRHGLAPIILIAVVAALLAAAAGVGGYLYVISRPAPPVIGGDRDANGCIGSAGYSWCEAKQKCLRAWEEPCDSTPASTMSEADARVIAERTCIKGGEALGPGSFNPNSNTWWFDANLNATKPGCSPACVVSADTKTAQVNWRCTGAILPFQTGIQGHVFLGPSCPVMRVSPDIACADKPYETTVQVILPNSPQSAPYATARTDAEGRFSLALPPGAYALQPVGGNPLPRCETKEVVVQAGKMSVLDLSCDTGIR